MAFSGFSYVMGFLFGMVTMPITEYCTEKTSEPREVQPNQLELTCEELGSEGKEVTIDGTPYAFLKCDDQGRPVLTLYESKSAEVTPEYGMLPGALSENILKGYDSDGGIQ
ncbi:hypothetical protein GOV03_04635 [Candidatus Woesearchaeota archaeon]|nr:hypothetical protein [Candidatus Woesearchaeota archaeon]